MLHSATMLDDVPRLGATGAMRWVTGVLVCRGRGSFTIRLLQARISQGFAFTLLCKSIRIKRLELYFF